MENKYTYRVEWSAEDNAFVGRCLEFPSLGAHGKTQANALREIMTVVEAAIEDMENNGEEIPQPIGLQEFKGKIPLRVSPELHRKLVIAAKEQDVSLNKFINTKLAKEL